MSRNCLAALFVILLAFSQSVSAQTSTPEPAPWPPDPNEIFVEGVSWSVFDEKSAVPLFIDWANKVIRITDEQTRTWHEYPFPEGKVIQKAERQPDGRIRVSWDDEQSYSVDSTLLLNPDTGLYEPPETVCKGKALKTPEDQSQWLIVYPDANPDKPILCNSSTGEQREDLPTDFIEGPVFATPNDNDLIIADRSGYQYRAFVYSLIDGSQLSLGLAGYSSDETLLLCDWLTETKGLLCTQRRDEDDFPTTYYEFDITQENSIHEVFYAWPDSLLTLENPKRYFVMYSTEYTHHMFGGWSGNEPFKPCTLLVYDATGTREHILGNNCIPILNYGQRTTPYYGGIPFYYLISDNAYNSTSSSVFRYDIRNETAGEPLLTGEIESILSVSPDERYMVLVLDDDGAIGFEWSDRSCCMGVWQVGILDTQTGKIIYRSEPIGVYSADQIIWLDDRTFAMIASGALEDTKTSTENKGDVTRVVPASLRRLRIQEDHVVTEATTTAYEFGASFDVLSVLGQYWLKYEEKIVVDLKTLKTVPLLRDDISRYDVSIHWNWEGPSGMRVDVFPRDAKDSRIKMSYLVSLPD